MEGHLVLASRGIMFYYVWIFFTKKYPISYHEYPPLPNQWWIQGRGPGGPGSPLISLFLDQTEAQMAEKKFFSLSKGLDDLPPTPPLSKGLDLALLTPSIWLYLKDHLSQALSTEQ